jgi:hypothetical protein
MQDRIAGFIPEFPANSLHGRETGPSTKDAETAGAKSARKRGEMACVSRSVTDWEAQSRSFRGLAGIP